MQTIWSTLRPTLPPPQVPTVFFNTVPRVRFAASSSVARAARAAKQLATAAPAPQPLTQKAPKAKKVSWAPEEALEATRLFLKSDPAVNARQDAFEASSAPAACAQPAPLPASAKASAEGEDEGAAGKCSSFCFYAFSAQLEEAIAALSVDIRREESLLLAEPAYDDSDFMSIYCNTFGLSE